MDTALSETTRRYHHQSVREVNQQEQMYVLCAGCVADDCPPPLVITPPLLQCQASLSSSALFPCLIFPLFLSLTFSVPLFFSLLLPLFFPVSFSLAFSSSLWHFLSFSLSSFLSFSLSHLLSSSSFSLSPFVSFFLSHFPSFSLPYFLSFSLTLPLFPVPLSRAQQEQVSSAVSSRLAATISWKSIIRFSFFVLHFPTNTHHRRRSDAAYAPLQTDILSLCVIPRRVEEMAAHRAAELFYADASHPPDFPSLLLLCCALPPYRPPPSLSSLSPQSPA